MKIAGAAIAATVLLPLAVIALGAVLAYPWAGPKGSIVITFLGGNTLPWACFYAFYRLEPTGTSLDLEQTRNPYRKD